jgi:hypothetical protein
MVYGWRYQAITMKKEITVPNVIRHAAVLFSEHPTLTIQTLSISGETMSEYHGNGDGAVQAMITQGRNTTFEMRIGGYSVVAAGASAVLSIKNLGETSWNANANPASTKAYTGYIREIDITDPFYFTVTIGARGNIQSSYITYNNSTYVSGASVLLGS